jgi:hypothetical protein
MFGAIYVHVTLHNFVICNIAPNKLKQYFTYCYRSNFVSILTIATSISDMLIHKEFCLLGYNALKSVESQPTFRRNISPPSSGPKNMPSKKPVWGRWQAETSVDFQRTTRRYIPEDRTFHNHRCGNLKSYILMHGSCFEYALY